MRPKKSLGQNFLTDARIQRRIVDALEAGPEAEVLEIGPGAGALTRHLVGRVGRLTVVELDDRLADALQREYGERDDVRVVQGDALQLSVDELSREVGSLLVVGNIPYNITTPLIFWLLERRPRPARIVLMVQREVADRILAPAGDKTYGALSVGVRSVADAERLFHVSRGAFHPVPDVDSTVIRLVPHAPPRLDADEEARLRTLTRTAFGRRRKQFQKILRSAPEYGLEQEEVERLERETGLDLTARPETLAPERFVDLTRALREAGYPRAEHGP